MWLRYRVYDVVVASDFPFVSPLMPSEAAPQVTFTARAEPPIRLDWEQLEPVYHSREPNSDDGIAVSVYRLDSCVVVRLAHWLDFYIGANHIVAHSAALTSSSMSRHMVDINFLGIAMAVWLECAGVPVLHASGVVVNDRAVGFLSHGGGGKSCMAATFMQTGHPLLTDDTLALEIRDEAVVARPGYPQLRLWPAEAHHFLNDLHDLPRVTPATPKRRVPLAAAEFGTFCSEPRLLHRVYVPQRRNPADYPRVEITPLSPPDAVFALVSTGYLTHEADALGRQAVRLEFFAEVARQVSVRTLAYPSGLEHLPRVRDAVLADLESL